MKTATARLASAGRFSILVAKVSSPMTDPKSHDSQIGALICRDFTHEWTDGVNGGGTVVDEDGTYWDWYVGDKIDGTDWRKVRVLAAE